MELSGMHFVYSGVYSRAYDLIFANVNTSRHIRLSGDINSNTIFSRKDKRRYFIGESFDDSSVQFDAEVITENEKVLPLHIQRQVEKWLFHQPGYRRLYVDTFDDYAGETIEYINGEQKQLYLNCRFIHPEKLENNGGVVGYKFTVECDNSMAWQDAVTYTYDIAREEEASNSTIEVNVDTDLNDYVYPKVTIIMGDVGGDVTIANTSDDASRLTTFRDLTSLITLTMNGNGINYISGDNYLKFKDRNFVRLVDGTNYLTIVGNISSIIFEFQNQRYM